MTDSCKGGDYLLTKNTFHDGWSSLLEDVEKRREDCLKGKPLLY